MTYRLTENVQESFDFEINGVVYKMRYPNGIERKEMAQISRKTDKSLKLAEKADKEGNEQDFDKYTKEAGQHADEMSALLEKLVSSDKKDAPTLNEALEDQPTPVLREFQRMIKTELSLEA